MIDAILVPKGAELAAVTRGLKRAQRDRDIGVIGLPVGPAPVSQFLPTLNFPLLPGGSTASSQSLVSDVSQVSTDVSPIAKGRGISGIPPIRLLVTGVCGSLSPRVQVGDCCWVDSCLRTYAPLDPIAANNRRHFSPSLTADLKQRAKINRMAAPQSSPSIWVDATTVLAASCDRTLCLASEKQALGQTSGADIVEMEGFAILDSLQPYAVEVAMLRVVSDRCDCDLPDLNSAISCEGELQPVMLAKAMVARPKAALSLIQGSLVALKQLERAIADLL